MDNIMDHKQVQGEIKQANFRLGEDDAEFLRKYCKDHDMPHAQGFAIMRAATEMAMAASVVPDRGTEIKSFAILCQQLMDAYTDSLRLAATTEDRIRVEYQADIDRSNKTISSLQAAKDQLIRDLQLAKAAEEESKKAAKAAEEESKVQSEIAVKATASAQDKQTLIDMITQKLDEASAKSDQYDALAKQRDDLANKLKDTDYQCQTLHNDIDRLTKELSSCTAKSDQLYVDVSNRDKMIAALQRDLEAAAEKSKLAADKSAAEASAIATAKAQGTIDDLQQKITDLTVRAAEASAIATAKAQGTIDDLQQKITELTARAVSAETKLAMMSDSKKRDK